MLEVKHEFKFLSNNYRHINVSSSIGEYSIAMRMIEKIKSFKYQSLEGMTMNDQFNHLLSEFQNTNIGLRIIHPISDKLSKAISTLLHPNSFSVSLECNEVRDDKLKIIMFTAMSPYYKSTDEIIDDLNLDQLNEITVDITNENHKIIISLSFDSLNVYNKMKLIGTIELIQELFICYTIVLPRSYMNYLEYTEKVEYTCRHHYEFL